MSYGYGKERGEQQPRKSQKYKKMHVVFNGVIIVGCCHSDQGSATLKECLVTAGVRVEPANVITFHTDHDKDGDE